MEIIITLGPKTLENLTLKDIKNHGATTIRYNFSHFNKKTFDETIKYLRENKVGLKLLGDIQGSKIRVWKDIEEQIRVIPGDKVRFCSFEIYKEHFLDKEKLIPLNITLSKFKKIRSREISLKDGTIVIEILKIQEDCIIGEVKKGGIIRGEKSCNIRGYIREGKKVNSKDKKDIEYCIRNDFHSLAISYVEDEKGLLEYKEYIHLKAKELKKTPPKIYAKIETPKGVKNIREIVEHSHGIIIGRGDLVPELGVMNIPKAQRIIIKNSAHKELIVATHIFNSITLGQEVTPAEINDIYWFLKSGVKGFMLSKETTIAQNPEKSIKTLKELVDKYTH